MDGPKKRKNEWSKFLDILGHTAVHENETKNEIQLNVSQFYLRTTTYSSSLGITAGDIERARSWWSVRGRRVRQTTGVGSQKRLTRCFRYIPRSCEPAAQKKQNMGMLRALIIGFPGSILAGNTPKLAKQNAIAALHCRYRKSCKAAMEIGGGPLPSPVKKGGFSIDLEEFIYQGVLKTFHYVAQRKTGTQLGSQYR